ncbi:MAG: ABC transporter ATP-binding protein [Chloroflexi bacterium]|nr:ABC transporter ATP-binding protein [Chloroflexota bacterium]
MAFIECDNLVKIYKVATLEVVALQGLDLIVDQGEIIALIGPSGSGKSTLMNVLGGLDVPSAGRVTVGDFNLTELNRRSRVEYRRSAIGFVWQQTSYNLIGYLSVRENVELPMIFAGVSAPERARRASELLEAVDMAGRDRARPSQLSGGEQQRTALAVAMANRPQLLLADEPTGEVDSEAAEQIFDTLRALNRAYGVTIVIVTHDHNVSKRVNRVIGMRDGRASIEVLRQDGEGGVLLDEEEFTVLDRAGRLQLPHAFIERLGMRNLVRLHLEDDHVAVYPTEKEA